jgi:aminoglycoside phosphotransferase
MDAHEHFLQKVFLIARRRAGHLSPDHPSDDRRQLLQQARIRTLAPALRALHQVREDLIPGDQRLERPIGPLALRARIGNGHRVHRNLLAGGR